MPSLIRIVVLTIALTASGAPSFGDTSPAQGGGQAELRVAVVLARPFSFKKDNGYDGYSIRLWKYLAQEAGLSYEYTYAGKVSDCLDRLVSNQVDIVVGPVSITSWREPLMEFTYPYYESGIGLLVSKKSSVGIPYLRFFLSWRLLALASILVVAITINAHVIWLLERRENREAFPFGYFEGLREGLWYSIGIVLVGYGDKEIRATTGRIAAVIWMLAGVGIYSYVMSSLISFVTVSRLTSDIENASDLRGKTVAVAANSPAQRYFSELDQGVKVQVFRDFQEALGALDQGRVTAVADDMPMLRYEMRQRASDNFQILDRIFEKQEYAFALRRGSPFRKPINTALVKTEEDGFLNEFKQLWFGTEQ